MNDFDHSASRTSSCHYRFQDLAFRISLSGSRFQDLAFRISLSGINLIPQRSFGFYVPE